MKIGNMVCDRKNSGTIILLLLSTNVIAEDKTVSPVTLDTITVSAQKRPEDLATVPISINVISGDKIADLGMRRLEDLSFSVPNLTISEGTSINMIFMRGIGSERNLGYEQSVGMFVDGVSFTLAVVGNSTRHFWMWSVLRY